MPNVEPYQKLVDETTSPSTLLDQLSTPSRLGQRPGLDRIRALLADLGNPQDQLRIIHIGGTSGKGSTATIVARVLEESGYHVGLHVKPHLEDVEERFVIDGAQIQSAKLVGLIERIAPSARRIGPSWYELTVAIAFDYFREEQVDLAVVEVGLGGTYDATNIVKPVAVALTNVDLDHTEILGDTVEKIALDKVGILKPGIPVVSGATQATVRDIVANRAASVLAPLWQIGREVTYSLNCVSESGSAFAIRTPWRTLGDIDLALLGAHQVTNAVTALAAIDTLAPQGFEAPEAAVRRALATVRVPGRMEIVRKRPLVILDGAHNPAKMLSLRAALDDLYPNRPVVGILAFKRGHDLDATLTTIAPRLSRAVLTQFDATTDYGRGQSVDPYDIERAWNQIDPAGPAVVEPDPIVAFERTLASADPSDIICISGSLYLVGVARAWARSLG